MVLQEALLDTQRAFDSVAAAYDGSHARNSVIHAMRQHTRSAVLQQLPPGATLLDLGCGPGRDAAWFARRGYRVTAVDWSPAMVREARHRVVEAGLTGSVAVHHLGIHDLHRLHAGPFDGAYSNLDPLNCVPDLSRAARLIGHCLRPGGVLVASVIGRICPWEILLYLCRGDWSRARVRFAPDVVAVPLNGGRVWMRYYRPREFEHTFTQAGFTRVALRSVALFVPPPYTQAFAERHPSLIAWLQRLDDVVGTYPGFRAMGDHFLMVLRKAQLDDRSL